MNRISASSVSLPLEDLLDAHREGRLPVIPAELQEDFDRAVAAMGALNEALTDVMVESADRLPPSLSADYAIEREIGRGGMGVVYLVHQRSLGRRVAVKVLRPGERTFGPLVRRFLDEARHLARLRHPHIVTIHEIGDADGEPYFTMDYVDGEPLSALLARERLTPSRSVEILKQVSAAVQHAHRQGIIHRDLKPANVLIDRSGHAFVTDFGLARDLTQQGELTHSGELLGTPQYMSPEQARGESSLVGEGTDIHALGLLLFEMLTGRRAFHAASTAELLVKLLQTEAPPLRSLDRRIPRDLETICLKCLQKAPASRYTNVSALLEDLRRFEAGEPLLARRDRWWTRVVRWGVRRWRVAATILGTATVVLAIGVACAPMIFDKSYEDLLSWAEEELRDGRPAVAAEVFHRALQKSEPSHRAEVAGRIAAAIREMTDTKGAVSLALKLIPEAPDVSFGRHDFLVAQVMTEELRSKTAGRFLEPGANVPPQDLDRVGRRLTLFLDGPWGTEDERRQAQSSLAALQGAVRSRQPLAGWSADEIARIPTGEAGELEAMQNNTSLSPWRRGLAAVSRARLSEAAGDRLGAIELNRNGLELLRQAFPVLEGMGSPGQEMSGRIGAGRVSTPEGRLLGEVMADLQRLDPATAPPRPGELVVRVDHPEILQDVVATALLEICDPSVADRDAGLSRDLSRAVPIGEVPTRLTLLRGRYKLRFAGSAIGWSPSPDFDAGLIWIDGRGLPADIVIGDDPVELPALSVRLLRPISVRTPEPLERFSLEDLLLTWDAVPGAASYRVEIGWFADLPTPTSSWFSTAATEGASLSWNDLAPENQARLRKELRPGRTGGFRVEALDADGLPLGRSREERRFLILEDR